MHGVVEQVAPNVSMCYDGESGTCGPQRQEPFTRCIIDQPVVMPCQGSGGSIAVCPDPKDDEL